MSALLEVADQVDKAAWKCQADAGIDLIGIDGTLYDQILDWTFYLGLAPPRFQVCAISLCGSFLLFGLGVVLFCVATVTAVCGMCVVIAVVHLALVGPFVPKALSPGLCPIVVRT